MAGTLYLVPTPIGNLGDISQRMAQTLAEADFIAAEDTRVSMKLLNHLGLKKPMLTYHRHNTETGGQAVLDRLLAGEDCALVTDAGMPAISDPGEELVARCVAQKRDLVEQDEFDTGARQLLNLGHTLGHGVEACSGYTVSHGRAVAIGMTLVTRAAVAFGRCPAEVLPRLRWLLERYGLPDATADSAQALYEKTLSDKKRSGDTISLVVPVAWGASQLVRIPVSELPAWIERGLGL